jgi:FkbM family methyltransferase
MSLEHFIYTVLCRPAPIRWLVNQIILAVLPASVRIGRADILLNPKDPVVSGALAFGVYERGELKRFSEVIRPGMTVVDVGANLGTYSAVALDRLQGHGRLLAIEPARENFFWLQRNARHNLGKMPSNRVTLARVALSDQGGWAILHKNPANKGDNRLYQDFLLPKQERVQTTTLDALCMKHGIDSIDVLKVDVQGLEVRVLRGAEKILRASPRCHLFCEFWPDGIRKSGTGTERFIKILKANRFRLFEVAGNRLRPVPHDSAARAIQGNRYFNLYAYRQDKKPARTRRAK